MVRVLTLALTLFMSAVVFGACGAADDPSDVAARATSTPRPVPTTVPTPTPFLQPTVATGDTVVATATPVTAEGLLSISGAVYGGTMRNLIDRNIRNCRIGHRRGTDRVTHNSCGPLTNSLLRYYPGDVIGPDLAKSWEFTGNGTVLTMNLQDDVVWHDGEPFTASDVVWNFHQWLNPPEGTSASHTLFHKWFCEDGLLACTQADADKGIVAIDPYTVQFTTLFPVGVMIPTFATIRDTAMHAPHVISALPADVQDPLKFDAVVGTGAFKVRSLIEGSTMIAERNDNYFVDGLPYLNGYEIYILTDPSLRLGNFLTRQLDVYSGAEVPFADAEAMKASSQSDRIEIINYYPVQSFYNYINTTTSEAMKDANVREAVFLAMDRSDANRVLGKNEGMLGGWMSPIGNYSLPEEEWRKLPGMDPDKRDEELARAKQLMTTAGYPDGLELGPLYVRNVVRDVEQGIWTADQLSKIGITTEVRPVEYVVLSEKRDSLDFDITTVYTATTLDEPENFISTFDCGVEGEPAQAFDGVCSAEMDDLIDKVMRSVDYAERLELMNDIERKMNDTYSYIRLFWTPRKVAHWDYVKGWYPAGISQYHQYNARWDTMYFEK